MSFLLSLILGLSVQQASTSYLGHVQNYVNLVSSYEVDGHSTTEFPPLQNASHPMVVNLSMALYAINGFDEVAGNIEIVSVLKLSWTDEMPIIQSITFQQSARESFMVPYDLIWTPKLVLTNAIGDTSEVGNSAYLCRFNMTSNLVTWSPRVVISAACTPDVTYYPFDKQSCSFEYTPWGFGSDEIQLLATTNEWDQSSYGESGEWDISSTETEIYTINGQSYIKFKLSIIRKPLYFAFNILLPVLVLCLLNSAVFLLPAESGERVGFSVTCFLTFVVLLNMIMDIMPRSSSPISFLCYYLVVMMANSGAMTLFTILLMRVYHKPEKSEVPIWLQRTVTFINCRCARLRCCVLCCRYIRSKCACRNKRMCGCSRKKTISAESLNDATAISDDQTNSEKSADNRRKSLKCFSALKKIFSKKENDESITEKSKDPNKGKENLPKDNEAGHGCKNTLTKCLVCFRRQRVDKLPDGDIESQLIGTNHQTVFGRPDVKKEAFDKTDDITPSDKVLERWEDKRANIEEKKTDLKDILKSDQTHKTAWEEKDGEKTDDKTCGGPNEKSKNDTLLNGQKANALAKPEKDAQNSKKDTSKLMKSDTGPEVVSDDSDDDEEDEDSLAGVEEEVKWPEVGRIMDTFFFLSFLGGQAFFTVIFLVPLFTAA